MIALAIIGAYLFGWLTFTVPAIRFGATSPRNGKCPRFRDRDYAYCRSNHRDDCWVATPGVNAQILTAASLAGLVWPILVLPALACHLATREPKAAVNQQRIDELERELGIGGAA